MWTKISTQLVTGGPYTTYTVSDGRSADADSVYRLLYWIYNGSSATRTYEVVLNSARGDQETADECRNGGGNTASVLRLTLTSNNYLHGQMDLSLGRYNGGKSAAWWPHIYGHSVDSDSPPGCSITDATGNKRPAWVSADITKIEVISWGGDGIYAGSVFELWRLTNPI